MKLYLLEQSDKNGYDTFDGIVVAAKSAAAARKITPGPHHDFGGGSWARSEKSVKVTLLGTAKRGTKAGVILKSFRAG